MSSDKIKRNFRDFIEELKNRTFASCTRKTITYDELYNTTDIKQSPCDFSQYEEILNELELVANTGLLKLSNLSGSTVVVDDDNTFLFTSSDAGFSGKLEIGTSKDENKTFIRSKFLSTSGLLSVENIPIDPFLNTGSFLVLDREKDTFTVSEKESVSPFGLLMGERCNITQTTYKFTKE